VGGFVSARGYFPMKRRLPTGLAIVLLFCGGLALAAPADEPTSPDPTKLKHDGGINDLDAIGNRNVGCHRGLGNWYSVEGQINMGRQYADQVDNSAKLIKDPVVTEYVRSEEHTSELQSRENLVCR